MNKEWGIMMMEGMIMGMAVIMIITDISIRGIINMEGGIIGSILKVKERKWRYLQRVVLLLVVLEVRMLIVMGMEIMVIM